MSLFLNEKYIYTAINGKVTFYLLVISFVLFPFQKGWATRQNSNKHYHHPHLHFSPLYLHSIIKSFFFFIPLTVVCWCVLSPTGASGEEGALPSCCPSHDLTTLSYKFLNFSVLAVLLSFLLGLLHKSTCLLVEKCVLHVLPDTSFAQFPVVSSTRVMSLYP